MSITISADMSAKEIKKAISDLFEFAKAYSEWAEWQQTTIFDDDNVGYIFDETEKGFTTSLQKAL